MFNSKLFVAFLAAFGVVGGVSASATLKQRQLGVCDLLVTLLGPDVESECCTSTIGSVSGLPVGAFIGVDCIPNTGPTCPPDYPFGAFCCVPASDVPDVPSQYADDSVCLELPL
ncbi:hypothetical protein BC834DRAFT_1031199 [Gloeopeniophorella convolvens]|nr:hypothetical protein BC834DRAFT_1031199 [Gloeopeniophorella convolvens]